MARVHHTFIARTCSLLARVVYATFILIALIRGDNTAVLFNSAVFIVTLVTWAFRDERALWFDALLIALFATTLGMGFAGISLASSILGWDKLFHSLAGVAVAGIIFAAFPRALREGYGALAILALACVVYVGWELYEWLFLEFIGRQGVLTVIDSILDVVADIAGGAVALWLMTR